MTNTTMAKEKKILFSTMQVTAITLFVKFAGMIKQSVLAACCGATMETDAFFLATGTMVNLSTIIFSAISISLLTIHTSVLFQKGREESNKLINAVLKFFLPLACGLTAIFYFFSPIVAKILAPAYQGKELAILAEYIQTMSVSFILWCYFLTVNVILETDKQFVQGKGQGLFQNSFLILGAILLYSKFGMKVLVYAFLLSGVAQCLLVTWCARDRFKITIRSRESNRYVKQLITVAFPLLLGNAMYEINSIVDGQVATSLGAGGASILNYGATINDMVVGVIVTSVSTVLFSNFSTWIAKNEIDKVELNLRRILEILSLILFPVMIMCVIAGDQIVEIFYGRGSFGKKEIGMTYGVVIGYALGFLFQAARSNLVKVYYAFQDSKRPMINGLLAVCLNVVLSIILSKPLGVAGIALATSISMAFVTVLLLAGVKRYLPNFSMTKSCREIWKGAFSAGITTAAAFGLRRILHTNLIASFLIEGTVVVMLYIGLLFFLKSENIEVVKEYVKSRMRR